MPPAPAVLARSLVLLCLLSICRPGTSQEPTPPGGSAAATSSVAPKTVEITPATAQAEVGRQLKFHAVGKDAGGQVLDQKPTYWFAAPFDLATADGETVTFFGPGEVKVGAVIGGKTGYAKVTVTPPHIASIEILPLARPVVVGGSVTMSAVARTTRGDPRADADLHWTSLNPSIAHVDPSGVLTGVAPGRVTVRVSAGDVTREATVNVVKSSIPQLSIEPATATARTGDVLHFSASAGGSSLKDVSVHWSVDRGGADIEPDGVFVAEQPGTYVVEARVGERDALASISVKPRNPERNLEVVGRVPVKDTQMTEEWTVGNTVFLASLADKVWAYDISNPAEPKLVDTLTVDARLINDVSTTPDGRIGVITREGASSRKNGIVFLDTSDPAHMKVLSEYTATVTGGVHSAFIDSHYVYLTDDATGSLRVIDFADPRAPKEVARFQVDTPLAKTVETPEGPISAGRYLHDVQVKDGLAYLAYWRDGLVILDVGNGMRHGTPEKPQLISQLRFNYHELYGDGWLAGAHAIFRYKNYVFVGDEVFPAQFNVMSRNRIPVRGIVHVVDVSDILHPRKVAEYAVPEAGAHNVWVLDDVLYMGYYSGGARVLDVSGELRGDLYRQGREIARLWTGDAAGYRPNLPFTWGAQPHNGLIYFNDINSGLWIVKLGEPMHKGSTTAPPLP